MSETNKPYSRNELESIGSDSRPERGIYCPKCLCHIPVFEEISNDAIKEFIDKNSVIEFIKMARNELGLSLGWAKLIVIHHFHHYEHGFTTPCPYCGSLNSEKAKQCPLCKMDWHNENNPIRMGESVADRILNAEIGSTLKVMGYHAYRSALNYAKTKRPDDNITIEFEPVINRKP